MKKSKYDLIFNDVQKEIIKQDYVNNGLSIRDISKKYAIKSKSYVSKLLNGVIRSYSEANKISHQKYPERYLHNDETKQILREKRLEYIKNNPHKTAWRQKNQSYPEKMFQKFLEEYGYTDNFLIQREYSVFPYFIDFAFVDLKIAIEIDGSQHLEKKRQEKDREKDILLKENGWRVIRISEHIVKTDWNLIKNILNDFISLNKEATFKQVGILQKNKSEYKYVKRDEFGRSEKMNNASIQQRKQIRPSANELEKEIRLSNFKKVGEKYGVSDNTIRKWCLFYGLSNKAKDYK